MAAVGAGAAAGAAALNPAASRLFRIRKTVCRMLDKRGYEVPAADVGMSADDFIAQFSEMPSRSAMSVMVGKRDNPDDKLIVFFPEADLGVRECKP
jgi:DNA-directed RNA polymerases I, II, and III subunit RPABC1